MAITERGRLPQKPGLPPGRASRHRSPRRCERLGGRIDEVSRSRRRGRTPTVRPGQPPPPSAAASSIVRVDSLPELAVRRPTLALARRFASRPPTATAPTRSLLPCIACAKAARAVAPRPPPRTSCTDIGVGAARSPRAAHRAGLAPIAAAGALHGREAPPVRPQPPPRHCNKDTAPAGLRLPLAAISSKT